MGNYIKFLTFAALAISTANAVDYTVSNKTTNISVGIRFDSSSSVTQVSPGATVTIKAITPPVQISVIALPNWSGPEIRFPATSVRNNSFSITSVRVTTGLRVSIWTEYNVLLGSQTFVQSRETYPSVYDSGRSLRQ